jgi:hypothetical protein
MNNTRYLAAASSLQSRHASSSRSLSSPEEIAELIGWDLAKWARVVKQARTSAN